MAKNQRKPGQKLTLEHLWGETTYPKLGALLGFILSVSLLIEKLPVIFGGALDPNILTVLLVFVAILVFLGAFVGWIYEHYFMHMRLF